MILKKLYRSQNISKPIDEVYNFFAEAKNLEMITPPYLKFKILKMSTENITKGTLIDYKLKLHGIPFFWKTRINEYVPNVMFIDEQVKGPYKRWVHTHTFQATKDGTVIEDHVDYEIPFGAIGAFFLSKYIASDLDKIFNYRHQIIEQYFNSK